MIIYSPQFSFVQFAATSPDNIPLPVYHENDLYFQIVIKCDSKAQADYLQGTPSAIKLVFFPTPNEVNTVNFDSLIGHDWSTDAKYFTLYRLNNTDILCYWNKNLTGIEALVPKCNECFRIGVKFTIGGNTYRAASNAFKRTCSTKFTSLVTYNCNEDSFDFIYCVANMPNRIRLPFYFRRVQFPDERTVYRKSNGEIKVLKAVAVKEYEVSVASMYEPEHQKMQAMLNHDSIVVASDVYNGEFVKNGQYNINYPDMPGYTKDAPANFKALVTPWISKNNNCDTCGQAYVPTCVNVSLASVILPDAVVGVAYSQNIGISGDAPFVLSNIVKPTWMTIDVVGYQVEITGTPTGPDVGNGVAVSFDISNCTSGTDSFSDSINVSATCEDVTIEVLSLPDAQVGVAYNTDIDLTGTSPFALANVVKPAWMTVNIVGSVVQLRGTPSGTATGVTVSFDVTNCTSGTDSFSDTIDVTGATCTDVNIVDANMPDGEVNVPYSFSLALTGTAPFVLTANSKPSWLNVAIVGTNIVFSGTPTEPLIGGYINLTVTNCTSGTDTYIGNLNVFNPVEGRMLVVGYGATSGAACAMYQLQEIAVYVHPDYFDISAGVYVYEDAALQNILTGWQYITNTLGEVFFMAQSGYVTGSTYNIC